MNGRTIAIANPHAGRGRVAADRDEIERRLRAAFAVDVFHYTTRAGDAVELAAHAAAEGVDRVVAVGGDGLLNEVVNGLVAHDTPAGSGPCLTACPVGSGNDFVKSLGYTGGWPSPFPDLVDVPCDVGRVRVFGPDGTPRVRHFLNVSSVGASAVIADHANRVPGFVPAKLRYRLATVIGLSSFRNPGVRITLPGHPSTEEVVSMIAVANGTTFGAGMKVAPGARLDDGRLRAVIVGDVGLLAFAKHGGALDRGEHVGLSFVRTEVSTGITIEPLGTEAVWVETDGERAGRLPASYDVLAGALRVSRTPI